MTAQLIAGFELLMAGMGIVFLFLALLVIASVIMSKIVLYYFPEVTEVSTTGNMANNDQHITAAITTAVHKYRMKHKAKH